MRILVLAAAATALSGCSFYDQQGTYGVSHISPYATTSGVYSGCAVSTYNGCGTEAYSQPSYSGCESVSYATECGSNSHYGTQNQYDQGYYNQGQQATNCGTTCDTGSYNSGYQYNQAAYNQGQYDANCASPCGTNYSAPQQTTTSYAVAHAVPTHYGVQYPASGHYVLRGAYNGHGYHSRRDYFYGELGAVSQYDIDGAQPLFGVQARLGYQSPNYVGVEIEASKGLTDDSAMRMGPMAVEDSTFEVDKSIGAFGVVRMPVGQVTGLLRAGYHETDFKTSFETSATEAETKGKGIAYGAGVEMPLSSRSALRVDATVYDTDVDSFWGTSVSYQHKF